MIYTEQQVRDAFLRYDQELCTIGITDTPGRFLELLHDEAGETEELYRCTECGKWSHAKRQPNHHQRFIVNPDEPVQLPGTTRTAETAAEIAADAELEVSGTVEPSWSGDPEVAEDPGGVWVRCGPFETWTATREDG